MNKPLLIVTTLGILFMLLTATGVKAQHALHFTFNSTASETVYSNSPGFGGEFDITWQHRFHQLNERSGIFYQAGLFYQPRIFASETRTFALNTPGFDVADYYDYSRTGASIAAGFYFSAGSFIDIEFSAGGTRHLNFYRETGDFRYETRNPDKRTEWANSFDLGSVLNVKLNERVALRTGLKSQKLKQNGELQRTRLSYIVGIMAAF